jgi:transposase
MLTLALPTPIYLCLAPTDMRKSFDSLAALVRDEPKGDLFSGSLFVFRSKRRDRIKLLHWDADGFMLRMKRLERGT